MCVSLSGKLGRTEPESGQSGGCSGCIFAHGMTQKNTASSSESPSQMGKGGDGRHLAIASSVYGVQVQATGDCPYICGREGPIWTVQEARCDCRGQDADERRTAGCTADEKGAERATLTTPKPDPCTTRRREEGRREHNGHKKKAHIGAKHAHTIMTINIGGNTEALINAMDTDARIVLTQEHWVARPGLPGFQGLAMGHGVWDAATTNGNGSSGGTAVLVWRPVQIMHGGRMDRGTIAVVSWTRKSRVHVASIYDADEGDSQHEDTTRRIFGQWQEYLAEVAGVPWVIGEDWNIEAQDAEPHWGRRHARMHDAGAATQRGRNIEWL